MANIKIGWKGDESLNRSQLEEKLRGEGWGSSMTDAQLDKCKHLERRMKEKHGITGKLHDEFLKRA